MKVRLDERGREVPSGERIEMPLGMRKPESIEEMIRRFVRHEASRLAESEGMESFEEADDFEVEDGEIDDLPSMYNLPTELMAPEIGPDGPESLDGSQGPKPGQSPRESDSVAPDASPEPESGEK